jgi:hypothetical protein
VTASDVTAVTDTSMRQQHDPHCVLEDEHDMEDMDEDEMDGMEKRSEEEEEFVLDERVLFQVTVRNVYRYFLFVFVCVCVCVCASAPTSCVLYRGTGCTAYSFLEKTIRSIAGLPYFVVP